MTKRRKANAEAPSERVKWNDDGHGFGPMMGLPLVALSSLSLDPNNAREHSDRNIEAIAQSIDAYGQRRPIVVRRRDRKVLAGNGMVMAMLARGLAHGEVLWTDDTDEQAAGFALADNRTAELAAWNLDNVLASIDLAGADHAIGWTQDEIDTIRAATADGEGGGGKSAFPELDGRKVTKSKPIAFYVMPDVVPSLQQAIDLAYGNGAGSAMDALKLIVASYIEREGL